MNTHFLHDLPRQITSHGVSADSPSTATFHPGSRRSVPQWDQWIWLLAVLMLGLCAGPTSQGADPPLSFNRDIRPILAENCFACHGFDAKHREAGLRLDTQEGATRPTESGTIAIQPGSLKGSAAWQRIISTDPHEQMPPPESRKELSAKDKALLRRWIESGAAYQQHWSFEPPVRHSLPDGTSGHVVDAFLTARRQQAGLRAAEAADRATLLRRLTFDLTGLPPTPAELNAFLDDTDPQAYEKQVDRLLAAPQFGERMATYWLDAARYGDTSGYLHDVMRTGWPWRDWVVRAFNDDLPFDQFVVLQLAGDLLPAASPQQILATSFLRNHPITSEGGTLAAEYLNEYAADRVQTVATTFLGLSFNCARCHDHKFDPVTMEDFYSLQAYFNSITEAHAENNIAPAYDPSIEIASPLNPEMGIAKVMVMQEAPSPTPTFILNRGQYDQPDRNRPVGRRPPAVLGGANNGLPRNRLGLALWLVSRENPLLARVTVNRFWAQIFGTGIVKSLDDFGVQGEYPVHPELLDTLAVEFRDGNPERNAKPWSVKQFLRLLVTSQTYRQSARSDRSALQLDPENRLLTHFPRQRLSAEEIRDQALFVSGLLSPTFGGPAVYPYQPAGIWEERANEGSNTKEFKRSEGEGLYRRSLYTFWKRTCPPPVMVAFDAPDRLTCIVRRPQTNTPLQALATLNDEQFLECAKFLAVRTLTESAGDDAARLTEMFRRVTSRRPDAADLRALTAGLTAWRERYRATPADAATLLNQGTRPVPSELSAPEVAAWMLVANAILNLDESLVRD